MFEQTFVDTQKNARKPFAILLSLSIQIVAIAF